MSHRRGFAAIAAAWVLPVLAIVTFALGLNGWLAYDLRLDEAAYRTVALFEVNNDAYHAPPGTTDIRFLIARWTGLFTIFGAALYTLGALLHEHVARAAARYLRQQVVIIGAEGVAMKAFDAARQAGRSVIWVGAPALEGFSPRAIALPWPPDDHVRTIAAYATGARYILLAQRDDAAALALTRTARASAPGAFITVVMHDARLAEDAAAMINEPRTRVISDATVSARALNVNHPPFLIARRLGHPCIHALIVGFGQTGQAIARDLIVNCRTSYLGLPRITVIDPNAHVLEGVMRVRAPELDACADFTFITGAIGTHGVAPGAAELGRRIAASGPVTAAYVCRNIDAEALNSAGMLQSLLRSADVAEPPIFVRLRDAETLAANGTAGRGLGSLIPFGELDAIVAASEFLTSEPDQAARAFSAAYRELLPPERRDDPSNHSARPWDELDETFRQATRDSVAGIPAKLASAGVDPALWVGVSGPPPLPREVALFKDAAECEVLARLEHERWNAQRRMDGWRWADLPRKDEPRRLHPDLKAYDALSDATQEYDRIFVREAQQICWDLGQTRGFKPSRSLT
jgi:hypothetical protein